MPKQIKFSQLVKMLKQDGIGQSTLTLRRWIDKGYIEVHRDQTNHIFIWDYEYEGFKKTLEK